MLFSEFHVSLQCARLSGWLEFRSGFAAAQFVHASVSDLRDAYVLLFKSLAPNRLFGVSRTSQFWHILLGEFDDGSSS